MCCGQITLSKIDEICPLANLKPDLHNINAHTVFGENQFIFTQVIIWKQKWMDGCMYDRWTEGHRDRQRKVIIPRHYRVARYKNDHKWSFFHIIYAFLFGYNTCLANRVFSLDPSNCVIKRL